MTTSGTSNSGNIWIPENSSAQTAMDAAGDTEQVLAESFDAAFTNAASGLMMAHYNALQNNFNQMQKDAQKNAQKLKENLRDG